jgi:hypothetical protein
VTVHGFTVGSPVVSGDAGSSVDGNGCGVLGGKRLFALAFSKLNFLKVLDVLWRTQGGATLAMILPCSDPK